MSGRRSCACRNRLHEHGCRRRYIQGCRECDPCRQAHTDYCRARYRRIGYQPWTGETVWAEPQGTVRRLQALAAAGWTLTEIGARIGTHRSAVHEIRTQPRKHVKKETADRVARAYEEMAYTQPPPGHGATCARTYARRHGWAPPMAWDDIDNDEAPQGVRTSRTARINEVDEAAVTRAMNGDPPTQFREVDKREAVFRLHHQGLTPAAIGRRLRMSRGAVDQHFARNRRAQRQEDAA